MNSTNDTSRGFGSDNQSGAHPRAVGAIAGASTGHVPAYGDDPFTARATTLLQSLFGECDVHFALTGTGANVIGIGSAVSPLRRGHLSRERTHQRRRVRRARAHRARQAGAGRHARRQAHPRTRAPVSHGIRFRAPFTAADRSRSRSSTELGTLYTAEEIRTLADLAHEHGMICTWMAHASPMRPSPSACPCASSRSTRASTC